MNIELIKARTENAREEGFGLQQFDDLDVLINKVEQLTAEVKCLDQEYHHYRKLSETYNDQIALLKNELNETIKIKDAYAFRLFNRHEGL